MESLVDQRIIDVHAQHVTHHHIAAGRLTGSRAQDLHGLALEGDRGLLETGGPHLRDQFISAASMSCAAAISAAPCSSVRMPARTKPST